MAGTGFGSAVVTSAGQSTKDDSASGSTRSVMTSVLSGALIVVVMPALSTQIKHDARDILFYFALDFVMVFRHTVEVSGVQLDLESIRTLIAVVDQGGMTSAAHQLGLSQSAVSHKIKRLEAKAGRPLLIRDGHDIRPNRDGLALVEDGRAMIQLHDRAAARLYTSELSGQVRLGANQDFDVEGLATVLGRFRQLHPKAVIQFVFESTDDLTGMIDNGEIDLAIIQVVDEDLRTDDVVLWTDQLCWVTSDWCGCDTQPVPLASFGEDCFYQRLGRPILEEAGVDWFVSFSGASSSAIIAAVEAGLGVGLVTSRYLSENVVEWKPPVELSPLPEVHQILRTVPGENPDVNRALIDVIGRELR